MELCVHHKTVIKISWYCAMHCSQRGRAWFAHKSPKICERSNAALVKNLPFSVFPYPIWGTVPASRPSEAEAEALPMPQYYPRPVTAFVHRSTFPYRGSRGSGIRMRRNCWTSQKDIAYRKPRNGITGRLKASEALSLGSKKLTNAEHSREFSLADLEGQSLFVPLGQKLLPARSFFNSLLG